MYHPIRGLAAVRERLDSRVHATADDPRHHAFMTPRTILAITRS